MAQGTWTGRMGVDKGKPACHDGKLRDLLPNGF